MFKKSPIRNLESHKESGIGMVTGSFDNNNKEIFNLTLVENEEEEAIDHEKLNIINT